MTPEVANVVYLAQRLVATPPEQSGLLSDRINDLAVALVELEIAERAAKDREEGKPRHSGWSFRADEGFTAR